MDNEAHDGKKQLCSLAKAMGTSYGLFSCKSRAFLTRHSASALMELMHMYGIICRKLLPLSVGQIERIVLIFFLMICLNKEKNLILPNFFTCS